MYCIMSSFSKICVYTKIILAKIKYNKINIGKIATRFIQKLKMVVGQLKIVITGSSGPAKKKKENKNQRKVVACISIRLLSSTL